MSQRESRLSRKIREELVKSYPGSWWTKTSGNNHKGAPDLVGCVEGYFFAFEVKTGEHGYGATRLQEETLNRIRRARGTACVVTDGRQATRVVEEALLAARAAQAAADR